MFDSLKDVVVRNNTDFWTKAKEEIDLYVMAMSAINNCDNFVTKAKAPETQKVEYEKVDITLRVPKGIDVEDI